MSPDFISEYSLSNGSVESPQKLFESTVTPVRRTEEDTYERGKSSDYLKTLNINVDDPLVNSTENKFNYCRADNDTKLDDELKKQSVQIDQ